MYESLSKGTWSALALIVCVLATLTACIEGSKFSPDAGVYVLPDGGTIVVPPEVKPVGGSFAVGGRAFAVGETLTLAPGESVQITATVNWSDGSSTDVTGSVNWGSQDPSVVSMSAAGMATGVKAGQTTIVVSAYDVFVPISVTVTEATARSLTVMPDNVTVPVGATTQLVVVAAMSDGSVRDVTPLASYAVDNGSVATASASGLLSSRAAGTTTVRVTYGTTSASVTMRVTAAPLIALVLSPASATLKIGETAQFRVTGTYQDGTTADLTSASAFGVSHANVASIDAAGLLKALSAGTVTVTATSGGAVGSASVTVSVPHVMSLSISPANSTVVKADEAQFVATATYSNGQTGTVTGSATWTTSDPSVGVIDTNGKFTAIKVGATEVRASFAGKDTYTSVTVTAPNVTSISVSPTMAMVSLGSTTSLTATARLSNGTSRDITRDCQWTTGASSVATVAVGVVTGLSAGSATITCSYEGRSAFAVVTVTGGYTVGGTVNGLWASEPPSPVGLSLNGGPTLYVYGLTLWPVTGPTSVPFAFGDKLSPGASYSVTVVSNPSGLECSVTAGGTGNVSNANVTSVEVTCAVPRLPYRLIFATQNGQDGNFGANAAAAIAAADQFCELDPSRPVSNYAYKAMMVNSARRACSTANCGGGPGEHLDWVLSPNMEYRRTDEATVIGTTTANGIFAFNLTNPITGGIATPWTGLASDWTNDADQCVDWTSNDTDESGSVGSTFFSSANAIRVNTSACNWSRIVYCVEQ